MSDAVTEDLQDEAVQNPGETAAQLRKKRGVCALCGVEMARKHLVVLDSLRPTLVEHIRRDFPDIADHALVSVQELARYRTRYVEEILREEHGEYSDLDREVAESIARQDTIAENIDDDFDEHRTLGERLSDGLASFGGSWAFLISFGVVLFGWMALNVALAAEAFDPYPFILLNLVLSCLAAIQAPIIMMSQKRQESKDRLRSSNDYQVNLKAELEIRHLHEKMDHLITRQWQRLAEIQQVQLELLQDQQALTPKRPKVVVKKVRKKPKAKAKPVEPEAPPPGAELAPAER